MPLCNAIVWLDQRTSQVVKEITGKCGSDVNKLRPICGLPINTYFSATKMRWMLLNEEVVKQEATKEDTQMCFGTIDTWLVAVSLLCLPNMFIRT
jgi:glycerol kinase